MPRLLTIVLTGTVLLVGCNQQGERSAPPEQAAPFEQVGPSEQPAAENLAKEATVELVSIGESGVTGTLRLTQEGETVQIRGEVRGLTPGLHGFHVHEKGDLSDKQTGESTGGHFNPTNQPHGRPTDAARHVGDLGNIEANAEGIATVEMEDNVISLEGEHSIIGRALVIHAGEDQFTQPSGDAGERVAFGVIGPADEGQSPPAEPTEK